MVVEVGWFVGSIIAGVVVGIGSFFVFKRHLSVEFPRLETQLRELNSVVSSLGSRVGDLAVAIGGLTAKVEINDRRIARIEDRS